MYSIFSHTTLHIQGGLARGKDGAPPSHSTHVRLAPGDQQLQLVSQHTQYSYAVTGSAKAVAYLLDLQQMVSNCSQGHNMWRQGLWVQQAGMVLLNEGGVQLSGNESRMCSQPLQKCLVCWQPTHLQHCHSALFLGCSLSVLAVYAFCFPLSQQCHVIRRINLDASGTQQESQQTISANQHTLSTTCDCVE